MRAQAIGPIMLSLGLAACASPTTQMAKPSEFSSSLSPPGMFKVMTYNVWHGLDAGELWVTPAESPEENRNRLHFQARLIAAERPDLILLQEVNPLPRRAEDYVEALAALDLDYTEVHQVDACGIRLSEDRALIPGLNNGLAILAKAELKLKKLQGLKLSGDLGNCESRSGIQLEELRYALVAEVAIPGNAKKYLVVSLHLHSGFESGTAFQEYLADLHRQQRLADYPRMKWQIEQPQLRRIAELDRLTRELRKLNREGDYGGMIIGGDFNFEMDSPEHEEARLLRMSDTFAGAQVVGSPYTADPMENALIRKPEGTAPPKPLRSLIASETEEIQAEIAVTYLDEMRRPRRIDYLFAESFLPDYCLTQRLFGVETDPRGMPPSDHYGVLNVYTRDSRPCRG